MKVLEIGIIATTACNRGCKHCEFDSKMHNRSDFTSEMARRLVNEVALINPERIYVCITGGGEPLLNRELPEIVRIFYSAFGNKIRMSIVTSGFLPENNTERQMVNDIMGIFPFRTGHLYFCLSFNQYAPRFGDRLETMLLAFESVGSAVELSLKPSAGGENYFRTLNNMFKHLGRFGIYPDFVPEFKVRGGGIWDVPYYRVADMAHRASKKFGIPFAEVYEKGWRKGKLRRLGSANPVMLNFSGRAKNLSRSWVHPQFLCKIISSPISNICGDDISFDFASNGDFLVLPSCYHSYTLGKKVALGNIYNNSLKELLERRKIFLSSLPQLFLSDSRLITDCCSLCSSIKAERFPEW